MIFNRTYQWNSPLSVADIKQRLLGKHIQVHHLDFEITEKESKLKIIPHAEEESGLKTLPITHLDFHNSGGTGTKIIVSSKPRKIDSGGPYLIVIFCIFCVLGAAGFYLINPNESYLPSLAMASIGLLVFIIFWYRMESGYFDYVRKIKSFVKQQSK